MTNRDVVRRPAVPGAAVRRRRSDRLPSIARIARPVLATAARPGTGRLDAARLGAVFAGAVLLAALTAGCSGKKNEAPSAPEALLVSPDNVVLVQERRLEAGIPFSGDLEPITVTQVNARFEADVQKVLVREGERVRRGQSLAAFAPRDVRDRLQAAEAELLSARAALAAAQAEYDRTQRLLRAGAASPADLESAESALRAAQARVRSAEASYNTAQENAQRLDVPAPISGTVSNVAVDPGDRPAVGDPLFTIVQTDTLELSGTVPSEALGRIHVGSLTRFTVPAFPNEVFTGRIDRISPTTEPGTRQVRIYSRVPNPEGRLVGGLFASGRVIEDVVEGALTAPLDVIRREAGAEVVYEIAQGTTDRVPVRTGLVDEQAGIVQLIGNISAGDSLLAGIVPGLRPGVPVRVVGGGEPVEGSPTTPMIAQPGVPGAAGAEGQGAGSGDAGGTAPPEAGR